MSISGSFAGGSMLLDENKEEERGWRVAVEQGSVDRGEY